MAAAALAFAACSSDELASVADRNANGLRPVEFSTVVKNQTRAGQIYNDEAFATIYMKTTGTFYAEDGTKVVDPSLLLTKSGSTWTYKVNGADEASTLYWPLESYDNTFHAWYYDGGATQGALNNKTADLDAVGAYATHSSTDEGNNVALNFYHAVSKAEFKVKVHEKTAEGAHKVKVDVKAVCLHNVNFKTSGTPAYTLPSSTTQMGAFAVDGTSTRDLVTAIPDAYEPAWVTEESAVTPVGSLLVMPQAIAAVEDFSTTTWSKPYISVLAQVRIDNEGNAAIFPKEAGANDYAWIALPLPADFTQMQAHHKYIFTLNFRNDALGRVDRDQNPNDDDEPSGPDTDDLVPEEDEGNPIVEPAHSGFALDVTVTDVPDFEEGGDYAINDNSQANNIIDLGTLTADFVAQNGNVLTGTLVNNVKVSIAADATVTLSDATINGVNNWDYEWAGITCLGNATIILSGTNTVKGFQRNNPGIQAAYNDTGVGDEYTLTIQGTGSLTASSNGEAAGIGGGPYTECGNITINGGTITATGGDDAAGIGSGSGRPCGNITISSGTVTATGGSNAAGIGTGGMGGICGNISISGGTIAATGGSKGAGIGTGKGISCGSITITSGVTSLTATKGANAINSIGVGYQGTCGTVTIGGVEGEITESPYTYPAPTPTEQIVDLSTITSAYTAVDGDILINTLGTGVQISIADGATITLRSANINGSDNLSGTFHGLNCLGDATIILENNDNVVKAKCGSSNDGRAGIFVPRYKTLTIQAGNSSGKIEATGAGEAAGIGGYYNTHCGAIVINSGKVNATAGSDAYDDGYGAGIGACGYRRCDGITITGGQIMATAYGYAAGIGTGGDDMSTGYCNPGDVAAITINISVGNGWVKAYKGSDATYFIGGGTSTHCGYVNVGGVNYEDNGNRGITSSTPESEVLYVSETSVVYMP